MKVGFFIGRLRVDARRHQSAVGAGVVLEGRKLSFLLGRMLVAVSYSDG